MSARSLPRKAEGVPGEGGGGEPQVSVIVGAQPAGRHTRRLGMRVLAALLLGLLIGLAALGAGLWLTTPSAADLTARVIAIGSADGARPLTPGQVPILLREATVAAEDERFFSHHGLDTVGTARAMWDDLTQLCLCQGGSTITQQLAKAVYYPNDSRISRKLPSMALAYKIELHHGKPEILADYLSVVRFGYGLVGARAASCAFFGHDLVGSAAAQLTVAEAAELAGSVQAPTSYDPRYHSDQAEARRDYAIDRMQQEGFISSRQAEAAKVAPVLAGGTGHPSNC